MNARIKKTLKKECVGENDLCMFRKNVLTYKLAHAIVKKRENYKRKLDGW